MASNVLPSLPAPIDRREGQWLTFHNVLLVFCVVVLAMRLYTIFQGGGWADRAQFFGEGDLRPNIMDFIYNEILINYLIVRVIAFRYNPLVYALIVLSAFAYFTRLPLILLFFAICFSNTINTRSKILLGGAAILLSSFLLYVRFGEDILYGENSAIFFLTYPFIGLGRLLETPQENGVVALQYISLFIKPVDAVLFVIDYVWNYAGELSTGRHVGLDLSQFVYIQRLQGAYNAFGSILYPFILIAGWIVGPILFIFFLIFQYLQYRFATQNEIISKRFIYLLLTTGILFSWTSPFVWLTPFLFTKIRHRRQE